MHLVVGATGLLGSEICRRLGERGKPVKALIRETADRVKVDRRKDSGVALAFGDLKDRASLDAACQGVTTVISTASATLSRQEGDTIQTVDSEGQTHLVDAAKATGVEQFIFISFRTRENPSLQYPLKVAKRAVEDHLMEKWTDLHRAPSQLVHGGVVESGLGLRFSERQGANLRGRSQSD